MKNKALLYKIIWCAALVLFVCLVVYFIRYGTTIKYFNQGNRCFRQYDYSAAEDKYARTLLEKYTKRMECKIRINYALSITTPITPESVNAGNLKESIARLEEARDILTANGCAHMNDSDGHSRDAQILKEEIDDYIKKLQSETKPEDTEDKDQQEEDDDVNTAKIKDDNKSDKEQELRDKFDDMEQEVLNERMQEQNEYQNTGVSNYFDGKNW